MKSTVALYVSLSLISCFPTVAVANEPSEPARPKPRFELPDGHKLVWEEITGPKYKRLACRKDGVLNGPCEEFTVSKNSWQLVQHGQYLAGKKNGKWIQIRVNDVRYTEDYENGELVYCRYFRAKDMVPIHDIPMRNGRPHGIKRSYAVDEGWLIYMRFHQNGVPVGPEIDFRPDRQVCSLKWNSLGVAESVGAMAVSFHKNGKLHTVGWQLDPGGHALSKDWAGPRLGFRANGKLRIEELRSNLGTLLYRKAYYPDGMLKAMIERHERKDDAKARPVWTREIYKKNVANGTVDRLRRAALEVDTYTIRLWAPNGELKKSEEVSGASDFTEAKRQVD